MNKTIKAYVYSPLMGGVLAGIIFWIYSVFLVIEELNKSSEFLFSQLFMNAITLAPMILLLSIGIAYIVVVPFLLITQVIKKMFFFKEGTTWFIMFLWGLMVGGTIAVSNYQSQQLIGKALLLILTFSFGFMFSASLFSIVSGKIQKKSPSK